MNKIVIILFLSSSLLLAGCSRPTTDATAMATPTPHRKSEGEPEKEQKLKAQVVEAKARPVEPMQDAPVMAISPSPSASARNP
jgi:PBP1b-binding outer membrane lipoprotein LpoB